MSLSSAHEPNLDRGRERLRARIHLGVDDVVVDVDPPGLGAILRGTSDVIRNAATSVLRNMNQFLSYLSATTRPAARCLLPSRRLVWHARQILFHQWSGHFHGIFGAGEFLAPLGAARAACFPARASSPSSDERCIRQARRRHIILDQLRDDAPAGHQVDHGVERDFDQMPAHPPTQIVHTIKRNQRRSQQRGLDGNRPARRQR